MHFATIFEILLQNPYRARPTRSRVDHSLGYGAHNRKICDPMSRMHAEVSSTHPIPHQPPIVNQSKQPTDPWNNSWNWDFDKQADNQQQQLQQQEQQHQQPFPPAFTNQGQLISDSVQDHYYQNINGNKSDLLNQNSVSDRSTTVGSRQAISNHSESFTSFSNYPQYQQYPPLPRTSSVKSVSVNPQWTNEQLSQRSAMRPQKDQLTPSPFATSNYNWHKPDQANLLPQHNWQSHGNAPGYWQEPKVDKEVQNFNDMGNQCAPPLQQTRSNQLLPLSTENANEEHSMNDANNWSNQSSMPASKWNNQNRKSVLPNQNQPPTQICNANNELDPWSEAAGADISQQWQHTDDMLTTQWPQEQDNNNTPGESLKQDNAGAIAANDWQQSLTVQSHQSLPNVPLVTESSTEQEDRKKSMPSLVANSMIPKDSSTHTKASIAKSQLSDSRLTVATTPETLLAVASSENVSVQESNDFNLASDPLEWGTNNLVEELPAELGQLSLGTKLRKIKLENQTEPLEVHPAASGDAWNQTTTSHSSATPDNISLDYAAPAVEASHSMDNQGVISKEHSTHNTYQVPNIKPTENIAQSSYDQWYNQNTVVRPPENAWYSKDHARLSKEWSTEQNVENYENIQQPSEFVNLEVVAPSLQERDIYGSRDSINKETLDNDPKPVMNPAKETTSARDFRQEVNNIEVPSAQQPTRSHPPPPIQPEQVYHRPRRTNRSIFRIVRINKNCFTGAG